ncbi:hypothetical protein C4J81_04265 [Deltaproteobacteria bacterium Smac51]|nr:hypothetical protein C4J81_04265 [Deltaproteobacteria bacterium Smac51]
MAAYSIVRIKKLKSWGAVAGSVSHNARRRETLNADPKAPCRFLIGSPDDDPVAVCKDRLGNQKIRKNAVYGVDGFLGASPEYFRPDAPDQYGAADQIRLDAWVDASMNWLRERYGDRIINAVLHLDEATPHIQFLLLPLDENNKLNCRALFGGKKYVLSNLQSDYAQAVSHLGLTRGREGSKATHMEVAEYYAATQKVERTTLPKLPGPEDIQPPEPPGVTARMRTDNLISYGKEAGAQAVAEQMEKISPILMTLSNQNDILITENARLIQEREQLKDANAQLSREKSNFKAVAKEMRDLDLDKVLIQMYGATEAPSSTRKYKNRIFILPDGASVEYTGNQWRAQSGLKGKGAVNLVMHLSGYGQDHYKQAVRELAEVFGDQDIAGSLAVHLAETAPREALKIVHQPFEMPKPCERTWPGVFGHLIYKMKLPQAFIEELHAKSMIFSDPRGNCVFARDKSSGVFKIGTGDKPFNQSLGKDGEPFVMPGTDNKVYVTDSLLEALSLKLLRPDSTVLATGGYMKVDKLKPYLEQREIFLAQSQDKIGQQMGRYLSEFYPTAKRIKPGQSQSWNEYRLLQLREAKEKEITQTQEPEKAHLEALTVTATVSRSNGLSR